MSATLSVSVCVRLECARPGVRLDLGRIQTEQPFLLSFLAAFGRAESAMRVG